MVEFDPHGQPFNVKFNRARRAERDLCELLGLARGLLADGVVTTGEATLLHEWVARHEDALDHWAVRTVHNRLAAHFEDGIIDEEERADLEVLLDSLVGGELSAVCDTDASYDASARPATANHRMDRTGLRLHRQVCVGNAPGLRA